MMDLLEKLSIRPALVEDLPTLIDFNCRLASETEHKKLDPDRLRVGITKMLEDPVSGRYFVACEQSQIVGQVMHTYEWSDWRNGEIWWLQSVYVLPDWRGKGVFRSLYEHVLGLARASSSVVSIRLYVALENPAAERAYLKLGMVDARYKVLEKHLKTDY